MTGKTTTVRGYGFSLSWAVLAAVMVYIAVARPADPSAPGYPSGQNHPGDLARQILVSLAVLGFVNAVVRPWARRSWRRTLVALTVLFPWMIAYAVFSMDAGSISVAHIGWLLLVNAALFMRFLAAGYESATAHGRLPTGVHGEPEIWIPWHPHLDPNDAPEPRS